MDTPRKKVKDKNTELNFHTYESHPATVNINIPSTIIPSQKSILSPRRSARLIEKTHQTSDYGTLSITSSISNLSISDVESNENEMKLSKINNIYILSRKYLRPKITIEFTQTNLNIRNSYKSLKYTSNTTHNLISIPFSDCDYVLVLIKVNQEKENLRLKTLTKTKVFNNHVSLILEKNCEIVLVQRDFPIIRVKETIQPEIENVINYKDELKIKFPPNCVQTAYSVFMELHKDDYFNDHFGFCHGILAAPVIVLKPENLRFKHKVQISVLIENYLDFLNSGYALTVEHCHGDKAKTIPFTVTDNFVQFEIQSFSFLRIFWSLFGVFGRILGNCTVVKCTATMETFDNNRFGVEISVFGGEKNKPEISNYRHVVGKSLCRPVRHGNILVILKSSLFEADVEAGEEADMKKIQIFQGQDLNCMFALKFTKNTSPNSNNNIIFGKVFIKNGKEEIIFEFNIQKTLEKQEEKEEEEEELENWSITAYRELATNLFIFDQNNWVLFAKRLGYTKQEIKKGFKSKPDPFRALVEAYRSRGGTSEEFLNCMYEIHREIKINHAQGSPVDSISSRTSRSSGLGSSKSSLKKPFDINIDSSDENEDESQSDGFNNFKGHSTISSDSLLSKRKRPPPKKKSKRRKRKYSSTSSDSEGQLSKIPSKHSSESMKRNDTVLETNSLWPLSTLVNSNSWKAVGRSLQLEESTLIGIEQSHKSTGNRECFYHVLLSWKENYPKQCTVGRLYSALVTEGLVDVARKMTKLVNKA